MPGCVAERGNCGGMTTTQSCFPFELEIMKLWVLLNSNTPLLTFYQGEVRLERKRGRGEVSRSFFTASNSHMHCKKTSDLFLEMDVSSRQGMGNCQLGLGR